MSFLRGPILLADRKPWPPQHSRQSCRIWPLDQVEPAFSPLLITCSSFPCLGSFFSCIPCTHLIWIHLSWVWLNTHSAITQPHWDAQPFLDASSENEPIPILMAYLLRLIHTRLARCYWRITKHGSQECLQDCCIKSAAKTRCPRWWHSEYR